MDVCDYEGGSTHESGEVITGAILTDSIDDLLCHWVAVKESRNGGLAKAEVKVSGRNVVACTIKGGQVSGIMTPARYHVPPGATFTSKSRVVQTSTRFFFICACLAWTTPRAAAA